MSSEFLTEIGIPPKEEVVTKLLPVLNDYYTEAKKGRDIIREGEELNRNISRVAKKSKKAVQLAYGEINPYRVPDSLSLTIAYLGYIGIPSGGVLKCLLSFLDASPVVSECTAGMFVMSMIMSGFIVGKNEYMKKPKSKRF